MENFDLVQVDEEDENNFYSGDAYVVLYAFHNGTRDSYMIYYWLVSEAVNRQGRALRGLPSMTSMKISDFWTPSPPCHIHDHATYQYSCPLFHYPPPPLEREHH